jgi:serine/threonine protein kinase
MEARLDEFQGTARFQLLRRLGHGGMGIVYEALDRQRNVRVALKTLRTVDATSIHRLKTEFRALQGIHHRNLVTLGELFEEGGHWFFTMELIPGDDFLAYVSRPLPQEHSTEPPGKSEQTLTAPLTLSTPANFERRRAPFDGPRLRSALVQLTHGLWALHANNRIHRDVKPSNIRVTPEGKLFLLDFGLVAPWVPSDGPTEIAPFGTRAYMAPEQAAGGTVGPQADWYSVGVLLYRALTGQLPYSPFLGKTDSPAPVSPSQIVEGISPSLDRLCMDLLSPIPGARPSAVEILQRLGERPSEVPVSSVFPVLLPSQFVGRASEMSAVEEAFEQSRNGNRSVVAIVGESGMGKSTLMSACATTLATRHPGLWALRGRCVERESIPYKAVDGIVDSLTQHLLSLRPEQSAQLVPLRGYLLPRAFPVLARVGELADAPRPSREPTDAVSLRTQTFAAFRELLSRCAERRPVVLCVDDVHWADVDSLSLLAELMRPPDPPQLMLLVTARSAESSNRVLEALGEVTRIRLGPLSKEESVRLASACLRSMGRSSGSAEEVAREARGHPLFLLELARQDGESVRSRPLRLEEVLQRRIEQLPPASHELLKVLSVAGAPVPEVVAANSLGAGDLAEFGERVTEMMARHLVRASGGNKGRYLEPYHDRVRECVVSLLKEEERRSLHVRLGHALEATGQADAEVLTAHFLGGGVREKATHYAAIAAKQALSSLAFDRAANLFRTALEHIPNGDARECDLRLELGEALANLGRNFEAAKELLQASKRASGQKAMDARRRAADLFLRSGHVDEGLDVLGDVLTSVGLRMPRGPRRALASLAFHRMRLKLHGMSFKTIEPARMDASKLLRFDICWSISVGLSMVDAVRGADFQSRALWYALQVGDPIRAAMALSVEGCFRMAEGAPSRQVESLLSRAEALLPPSAAGFPVHGYLTLQLAKSFCALIRNDPVSCLKYADEACAGFIEHYPYATWEIANAHQFAVDSLYRLGRMAELDDRVQKELHNAVARGDRFGANCLRGGYSHISWLIRDQPDVWREQGAETMREWSQRGFHFQHMWNLFSQVQTSLYSGQARRALEEYEAQQNQLHGSMIFRMVSLRRIMTELRARALLAVDAEKRRISPLTIKTIKGFLRLDKRGHDAGQAHALMAQLASLEGDASTALSCLRRAEVEFDLAGRALLSAAARRARGLLLGGDEGKALVQKADAWMRGERIIRPARMAQMLLPGLPW